LKKPGTQRTKKSKNSDQSKVTREYEKGNSGKVTTIGGWAIKTNNRRRNQQTCPQD
jgi:hypothetical protein